MAVSSLFACTRDGAPRTPAPVALPTHDATDAPSTLIAGTVVLKDGCLYSRFGKDRLLLLLWPHGTTLLGDDVQDSNGDVIVSVGGSLYGLGGTIVGPPVAEDMATIPPNCETERYMVVAPDL